MSRTVVLESHTPEWDERLAREQNVVRDVLGANLVALHHIGSTSIPRIVAKPIIDLMPVVQSLDLVDGVRSEFEARGYLYRGEYGMVGRRYVVGLLEGGQSHSVHIHILPFGHDEIERHLVFRDHLRENREAAKAYENLKIELKNRFEGDRQRYQDGKADFCESLLRKVMGKGYKPPAPWSEIKNR